MKTQTQTLFNKTGNTVSETPVKGLISNQSKTFRSVDMWNIHRQKKSLVIR